MSAQEPILKNRSAVIVAGGTGSRMQSTLPKQFLHVKGLPLLMHTIIRFHHYSADLQIVLVLPQEHIQYWKELCQQFEFQIPHEVISGGATRSQSVRNGVAGIPPANFVAVHDGARPLVSKTLIDLAFESAERFGSGVAAVPSKDSIRQGNTAQSKALDRSEIFLIQTPQVFKASDLQQAFSEAPHDQFTDEASLMEYFGHEIRLSMGDYRNIKITTPEDILIAEAIWFE